jgi:hypothetical protein
LLALSSITISSSLVLQCWSSLQQLSMTNRVGLFWVPGHYDILGNEKVDQSARRGSGSAFCAPEPCLRLSTSSVRQNTKEWAVTAHSRHWAGIPGCKHSKQWIASPKLSVTKYLLSLSRNSSGKPSDADYGQTHK